MRFSDLFAAKPKHGAGPLADMETTLKAIAIAAFPNGQKDITEGGTEIRRLSNGKLSQGVAESLFAGIKPLLFIVPEKLPEPHVKNSIRNRTGGELTESEVNAIYRYFVGDDGSGSQEVEGTREHPVVINHTSSIKGIQAEYEYLRKRFGEQDRNWELVKREQGLHDKHVFDCFIIAIGEGHQETIYFNITKFMSDFVNDEGTREWPIVINHTSSIRGIQAEYEYLRKRFGEQDYNWELVRRVQTREDKQVIDCFVIEIADGHQETIYFDITKFRADMVSG